MNGRAKRGDGEHDLLTPSDSRIRFGRLCDIGVLIARTRGCRRRQSDDSTEHRYAHAVNLCEVYYDFVRNHGQPTAKQVIQDLLKAGVVLRDDLDIRFWQQIGELKVTPGKLSLADCFALALALKLGAILVTSDHHEFDPVASSGLQSVLFIR